LNTAACAIVVHLTPRRIRIKIPGWERRNADFLGLQRRLEACPDVIYVHVNPLVASIVIHCRDGFEIMSARHCFSGLELVLPVSVARTRRRTWQIAASGRVSGRSAVYGRLAALALDLAIAVAARRLERLIGEWIIQAVVQLLLRQLHRNPTPLPRLEISRPLLAAAAR
jgi:hypothetical protein